MGCMGSKPTKATAEYRPPATSVSLFDISAVEEPWVIAKNKQTEEEEEDDEETTSASTDDEEEEEKPMAAVALLEKLEGYELAPASWSEVSKALLEDMLVKPAAAAPAPAPKKKKTKKRKKKTCKKKQQLQEKAASADEPKEEEKPMVAGQSKGPPPELAGRRVVKDNPFLMRDRENPASTNNNKQQQVWRRRDPFEGCPERRPPGASGGGVVLYTTTLRGVRRTFEDCEQARELVEAACAEAALPYDERDVSLHAAYLRELRDLVPAGGKGEGEGEGEGEAPPPPRLFVMGWYVGGAEECARLADSGKLREMMRWAKARGEAAGELIKDGRGCMGCGGARFVPCWECGGSCKLVVADHVQRCAKCNENGLMMCPICH